MLRRANDHETAAFLLVERTMRRTRPSVGALGLRAFETRDGRVERGSLGRLRFRFDGNGSDFEPENGHGTRAPSEDEVSLWNGLQRLVSVAKPVADPDGTLLSMRLGPRILRRLPLGGVVTFVPNGTPPFVGSFLLTVPEPALGGPSEAALLEAIDAFLREPDRPGVDSDAGPEWKPPASTARQASHIVSTRLGHGRGRARGKWYKCPICRTPVVRGPYNPRIPFGSVRGAGAIRDLRGGYLTRLRETYLVADPASLVELSVSRAEPDEDAPTRAGNACVHG